MFGMMFFPQECPLEARAHIGCLPKNGILKSEGAYHVVKCMQDKTMWVSETRLSKCLKKETSHIVKYNAGGLLDGLKAVSEIIVYKVAGYIWPPIFT